MSNSNQSSKNIETAHSSKQFFFKKHRVKTEKNKAVLFYCFIFMDKMLSIEKKIIFDDSVIIYEIHSHQPYGSPTYNNKDEIRIGI